jgi:hypothetical protein
VTPAPDPRHDAIEIRAVVELDDAIAAVRRDGTLEPVVAGGHTRNATHHATATRRRR